jgi:predicted ester cyclase
MSAKENENVVRQFIDEAYNKGNLAIGDERLTPDCVFHVPGADIRGIAGWKQFAGVFLTAFPDDLQCTIEDVVVEANKVAACWIVKGTHNGVLRGIPPTGKQVAWMGMAIYYLSDGKIHEVWGVNDTLGIMQQVGAIPSR